MLRDGGRLEGLVEEGDLSPDGEAMANDLHRDTRVAKVLRLPLVSDRIKELE